jgi:DNA-binding response OmpR family regulator
VPKNRSRQILIVDDDGTIRTLLSAALEECGYRVVSAASGVSMREVLVHGGIDAVVLDVRMPEEDGHSLALHAQDLGLPVVMMSGSGEEIAFAERLGLQLLRKPFRMQELLVALDAALIGAVGGA